MISYPGRILLCVHSQDYVCGLPYFKNQLRLELCDHKDTRNGYEGKWLTHWLIWGQTWQQGWSTSQPLSRRSLESKTLDSHQFFRLGKSFRCYEKQHQGPKRSQDALDSIRIPWPGWRKLSINSFSPFLTRYLSHTIRRGWGLIICSWWAIAQMIFRHVWNLAARQGTLVITVKVAWSPPINQNGKAICESTFNGLVF